MEFVEGWTLQQTLGEGAFGEVKLIVSKENGKSLAMKIMNLKEHPEAEECFVKETSILRLLNNQYIIKYVGKRIEETYRYIFLEYATGGELFDKIEPDVGMESWEAQKYMKQLTSGVEYLHSQGVVHRDLKPENLLLDEHDNLKITDFGMATIFRFRGKERLLEKRCGTRPYMAPEVFFKKTYKAEPVDVWSCGIVLVAMLAGELPWENAVADCDEYRLWKSTNYMSHSPWTKLDNLALSLLRRILNPLPSARLGIDKIQQHRWCAKRYSQTKGPQDVPPSPTAAVKRLRSDDLSPPPHNDELRLCQSQPESVVRAAPSTAPDTPGQPFCFSQPAQIQDMLVSTQFLATQSSSQNSMQKLVRRMTRFFVSEEPEQALESLIKVLQDLQLQWRRNTINIMTISTFDKHKNQLVFKANVLDMDKQTLLDFRLSKGCGLEFKRKFLLIRKLLNSIVVKGPVSWSIAMATNKVP